MTQLFPVPDAETEERMRKALDILEIARRIERRLQSPDDRLTEIREQAVADNAQAAIDTLCAVVRDGNIRDEDTAVELLQLMTSNGIQNPVSRISQVFGVQ
jgi:hypothetical protein